MRLLAHPTFIMAVIFAMAIGVMIWWVHDDYIEFVGTVRTHVVNFALIVGITGLVLTLTWGIFTALFARDADGLPLAGRGSMRLLLLYELVPVGVFVARYGVIDLGGYQLARWPMILGGWVGTGAASAYLLITHAILT